MRVHAAWQRLRSARQRGHRMARGGAVLAAALAGVWAAGCTGETPAAPDAEGCSPARPPATLGVLTPMVVQGDAARCLVAPAGRWLVIPQLSNPEQSPARWTMVVGAPGPATTPLPGTLQVVEAARPAAEVLHARLRAAEADPPRPPLGDTRAVVVRRSVPSAGSVSAFQVLSVLSGPEQFVTIAARAVFVGRHVVVYVDTAAPDVVPAERWRALGQRLDDDLHPAAVSAFGAPSDLDGDGRTLIVLTPVVNALVTEVQCARRRSR